MAGVVAAVLALAILLLPTQGQVTDEEWYRFTTAQDTFAFDADGVLHVLGVPEGPRDFGYIATQREHSSYHLQLRYKWGQKKFAPRQFDKRDAGVLYHVTGPDQIWPRSVECQIQEGDTGDIFLVGGTSASTTIAPNEQEPRYDAGGTAYQQTDGRIAHAQAVDSLSDWNDVDVWVTGDRSAHEVNGHIVARLSGMSEDRGRILLQAEGAEVFYDAVRIDDFTDFTPAPANATMLDIGAIEPGKGDKRSAQTFGDFQLHVEFLVPATAESAEEQERGNSGIYLQERYELQVLDSYKTALSDKNDAGAIYDLKDADVNAARPSGIWQSYDVTFHAARFENTVKTQNARASVVWNGTLVQNDVELPGPTPGGTPESPDPGALLFQDHGHPVQYRNVWVVPL